ncbi:PLP-dependent cysteine synthase family protein [Oceanospirillaceae bacterium]|nr:PLP-dependent cysteine synthase family protein [Oceanospirillaceae bacterium]
MRHWVNSALSAIEADYQRSADTHLIKLELPNFEGINVYLKDESTHPTGSLKHRLARSLFLYALCNGKIDANTTVVEASSGSTAVSEAYFAKLIGVTFIAVMPKSTSAQKIAQIEGFGGHCHFVDNATQMHAVALKIAQDSQGYFMDQFMYAERATDWRGNNNIAESIFRQMSHEPHPIPHTVVMSAGTGGTSATLGRYIRYLGYDTDLVVVDPENSAFYPSYMNQDPSFVTGISSRIEGIGRPQVEASFMPDVIDSMIQVPDLASIAAMLWLEQQTGRKAGPSTGTNLWGALEVAQNMRTQGLKGSIVTLLCDSGDRYLNTHHSASWVAKHIGDPKIYQHKLEEIFQ